MGEQRDYTTQVVMIKHKQVVQQRRQKLKQEVTLFESYTMNLAVSNENLTPEGGALRMCKTTTFTTIFQYNSRQLCIAQPHFTCMSCT